MSLAVWSPFLARRLFRVWRSGSSNFFCNTSEEIIICPFRTRRFPVKRFFRILITFLNLHSHAAGVYYPLANALQSYSIVAYVSSLEIQQPIVVMLFSGPNFLTTTL